MTGDKKHEAAGLLVINWCPVHVESLEYAQRDEVFADKPSCEQLIKIKMAQYLCPKVSRQLCKGLRIQKRSNNRVARAWSMQIFLFMD